MTKKNRKEKEIDRELKMYMNNFVNIKSGED